MSEASIPEFRAGRNIAMKVPAHEYEATLRFYRDILGLPVVPTEEPAPVFQFGLNRLWIDKEDHLSQAELWLELATDTPEQAKEYLVENGVVIRDEIEELPEHLNGFWITNPANIIHLVCAT
jgi:hypothetical protein